MNRRFYNEVKMNTINEKFEIKITCLTCGSTNTNMSDSDIDYNNDIEVICYDYGSSDTLKSGKRF